MFRVRPDIYKDLSVTGIFDLKIKDVTGVGDIVVDM